MSEFNKIDKAVPQEVDRREFLLRVMGDTTYLDDIDNIEHLRNEAKFWRRESLRLADEQPMGNERNTLVLGSSKRLMT